VGEVGQTWGVQAVLSTVFEGLEGLEGVWVCKPHDAQYDVMAKRKPGAPAELDELAFEAFCYGSDRLIEEQHLDPTKHAITWLGLVDIIPKGAVCVHRPKT
jgi:hypothetical protein